MNRIGIGGTVLSRWGALQRAQALQLQPAGGPDHRMCVVRCGTAQHGRLVRTPCTSSSVVAQQVGYGGSDVRYNTVQLCRAVPARSPVDGRLQLGPVSARCVACGARLHRACPAYRVMLRVMMGMHQWGLRRFPPRDARERSCEPGRVLAGGRGVVLGMSSQRESAGASQRYLLAEGRGRRVGHVFTARVGGGEPTVPIG